MPFSTVLLAAGRPSYLVTISANRGAWKKSVDGSSIPSTVKLNLLFVIEAGVDIQSITNVDTLTFDSLADGSRVTVQNLGHILGEGGNASGGNGTHAIRANFTGELRLDNGSGTIKGGGGAGGNGGQGAVYIPGDGTYDSSPPGAGSPGGGGGGAGGGNGSGSGTNGTVGNAGVAGNGAAGSGSSGNGGNGGAYGVVGSAGNNGLRSGGPLNGTVFAAGLAAGQPGNAIKHNAGTTITWISGAGNIAGAVGT